MGKVGSIISSEIIRLAKREVRGVSIPLGRDVRLLKNTVSQLRKSVLILERSAAQKQKELSSQATRGSVLSQENSKGKKKKGECCK